MAILIRAIASILMLAWITHGSLAAEVTEYRIKAAMLCNFALFVEWPTNAFGHTTSPLVLGVLGEDPFGTSLDTEARSMGVQGRKLEVQRFRRVEDVKTCHILFVGRSERERLAGILAVLRQQPVLTVSDIEDFCSAEGMIGFVIVENKVRFEVNSSSAERAGLRVSSHLLRLARKVWTKPRKGEQ